MTITIYELLGLIKDGKAPKKIKYDEKIWEYQNNGVYSSYWNENLEFQDYMESAFLGNLNDTVEILKEENKIEKLDEYDFERGNQRELAEKINEIIDEINKLKEDK